MVLGKQKKIKNSKQQRSRKQEKGEPNEQKNIFLEKMFPENEEINYVCINLT